MCVAGAYLMGRLFVTPSPPVYVSVPATITDSMRTAIVNEANEGFIVGTEHELSERFGITKTKWRTRIVSIVDSTAIDSLGRIVGELKDSLRYVRILTDSVFYDLKQIDSTLGVGFTARIGLSDTVFLEPINAFKHEFWLDSLEWKITTHEPERLTWAEWVVGYPERVAITGLTFLILLGGR